MTIRQLSLFLENRPGQLRIPCKLLGDAGIDILATSLADTQRYGVLRLVVKDAERAQKVLEQEGIVAAVTDMLAVDVPDRPGGLAEVLEAFEQEGLGIEYMYVFAPRQRGPFATLLFRLDDPDRAARLLQARGVRLVTSSELCARAGA